MRTQEERDEQTVQIATGLGLFVVALAGLAVLGWLASLVVDLEPDGPAALGLAAVVLAVAVALARRWRR